MIPLTRLRTLDLADTGDVRLSRHLSAASGLACPGAWLYVVADDELHLGVFAAAGNAPGHLIRLFDGELPEAKRDRKRHKPDLEAIAVMAPFGEYAHGALLALGSGSKRKRRRGAVLGLDAGGAVDGAPRVIDFKALYEHLDRRFPALNIEGALVRGDEFCLLQRGNIAHPENAIVRYPLTAVLAAIEIGAPVGEPAGIDTVALGEIDGVPLTFTDGTSLPGGGIAFTAVAENTADTYNDGACLGSAVGIVDRNGRLRFLERLEGCHKVEGIAARVDGDAVRLLLVTDADDPDIPANLFAATIPNALG